MSKTTSYYNHGNKIFYPSKNKANVPNALDTFDQQKLFTWKFVAGSREFGRDLSTVQSFEREKNERNYFYYSSAHSFDRIKKEQTFKNEIIELLTNIGLFGLDDLPDNATDFDKEVWTQVENCLKLTNSKGQERGTKIKILVQAQCCSANPDTDTWHNSSDVSLDTIPPYGFNWDDETQVTVFAQNVSDTITTLKAQAAASAAKGRTKCNKMRYRVKGFCKTDSGIQCGKPGVINLVCEPENTEGDQ
jgi:hypothetical protein